MEILLKITAIVCAIGSVVGICLALIHWIMYKMRVRRGLVQRLNERKLISAQLHNETVSSIIGQAIIDQCSLEIDHPEGSATITISKTLASKLKKMSEELEIKALPTIIRAHGRSDGACWSWCGENHCDTNGCAKRTRQYVKDYPEGISFKKEVPNG